MIQYRLRHDVYMGLTDLGQLICHSDWKVYELRWIPEKETFFFSFYLNNKICPDIKAPPSHLFPVVKMIVRLHFVLNSHGSSVVNDVWGWQVTRFNVLEGNLLKTIMLGDVWVIWDCSWMKLFLCIKRYCRQLPNVCKNIQ
jgi:hypothetical protein